MFVTEQYGLKLQKAGDSIKNILDLLPNLMLGSIASVYCLEHLANYPTVRKFVKLGFSKKINSALVSAVVVHDLKTVFHPEKCILGKVHVKKLQR